MRTVGEVAQLLGLSVRTLHYWEERGLVVPERTWSEYRLYSDADIARLQQVMVYRAAGMALDAIRDLLNAPGTDIDHFRRQRQLLMGKKSEIERMLEALDYLEDTMNDHHLSVDDVAEILGEANFPAYQAEAKEAYGGTPDWEITRKRQAEMTKDDWADIVARQHDVEARLAQAMQAGVAPDSAEARALAEEHRVLLAEGFFPVTHAKHVILGRSYVVDRRFRAHYDDVASSRSGSARRLSPTRAHTASISTPWSGTAEIHQMTLGGACVAAPERYCNMFRGSGR